MINLSFIYLYVACLPFWVFELFKPNKKWLKKFSPTFFKAIHMIQGKS